MSFGLCAGPTHDSLTETWQNQYSPTVSHQNHKEPQEKSDAAARRTKRESVQIQMLFVKSDSL